MQIIKVPGINGLGKTNGCRDAGNAIISRLDEIHTNEKGKPINKNLLDLEEIHLNNKNLEEQEKLIYKNSLEAFQTKDKVIFLGGDHSISFSIGKAFLHFCNENNKTPCLIVFDAHPDCMPPMKEPTHEEWLRALIEEGFPKENILLIGSRNATQEEIIFLKENKIKQININELNADLEEITDIIMEFSRQKELYVSLDIDVIDPAFAPSTSYKEPGGITPRQLIYLVSRLSILKNLKAIDIVEVDSEKDKKQYDSMTTKLASKLLAEFL
ncbi:MAG: arginase family protein [Nanoarchaeota archaeon]|nr:arginase family protein [Nanoarchaeota archaeon]